MNADLLATITSTRPFTIMQTISPIVSTDGTVGSPTLGQIVGKAGHFPFGKIRAVRRPRRGAGKGQHGRRARAHLR